MPFCHKTPLILVLFISFGLLSGSCTGHENHSAETSELNQARGLAEYMYFMQVYTHKVLLSVDAENEALADFYLHELEEITEDVIDYISEYDGYPVSELTRAMLLPVIEDLEDELETGDWESIRQKARVLVRSCNSCHAGTGHEYIIIPEEAGVNPFLQQF